MILQNVALFSEFPTKDLSYLADIAHYISIESGCYLFKENESSDSLYILLSGKVNMLKEGEVLYHIKKYETAGTFGFFTREPRIFSALCVKPCRVIGFRSTSFFDLIEQRGHLAQYLLRYFLKSAAGK